MKFGRVNQIQFFRFIAFFLLFQYHASMWLHNDSDKNVSGLMALFFFILLSGVMSSYSLYSVDIEPTKANIFKYVKKKLIRFYPLYIVTNLMAVMYTVPSYMVASHNFREIFDKGIEFIATVFLCQTWIFKPYVYNAASWYISSIVWLSILNLPFSRYSKKIMLQGKAIRKFVYIALAGIIYTLVAALFSMAVLHLSESDGITAHPLIIGGFYVSGMAIGNIVILVKERYPGYRKNTKLFTVIELALLAVGVGVVSYSGKGNIVLYFLPVFLDCAILIVYMLGYGKVSNLFTKKYFVLLGNITFEAYLLHQVIIFLFANVNDWANDSRLANFYSLAFCLTTSLVVAYMLNTSKNRNGRIVELNTKKQFNQISKQAG